MELKDFKDELFKQLNIKDFNQLTELLQQSVKEGNFNNIIEKYDSIPKDDDKDYIQSLYQFYLADREEKSQDFTPKSLAKLCAKLTTQKGKVLDLCAGVGTLTITHNKSNPNHEYHLVELDENVIPFLLLNLCYNNIEARIDNMDAITGEIHQKWYTIKGKKYATLSKKKQAVLIEEKPVNVISNPPFNLRINDKLELGSTSFKGLMNYAFIERAILESSDDAKMAFILPNGVLSSTQEEVYRKKLVDEHLLCAVINCPDRMFESTSIPVCVLYIDKSCDDDKVTFIDARETYDVEIRLQKGEGSASHRNRTYKKNMAVFTDKHITEMITAITEGKTEQGHYATVTSKEIQENDYILGSNRYVGFKYTEKETRPYLDIINDINRIITEKNKLKLTCNKVWSKELGLDEIIEAHNEGNTLTESTNSFLEFMELPEIEKEDWIASSNSKVLKWENKDKTELSTVLTTIIPMWKQHIVYLNNEENRLLGELRDKLIPDLMSGKIDVNEWEIDVTGDEDT